MSDTPLLPQAPSTAAGPPGTRAANTCRALADLRVIDLTGALGAVCGKILADLGADVLRIEPPGGHPLRRRAPLADGVPDGEAGLGWWAYAAGCDTGTLDLARGGDRARLLDLAARADVVVESFAPGHLAGLGLGWDALHRANPALVLTSITPFGQTGPQAGFRAPELVLQAMGGMVHHVGDPDRPPVRVGGDQAALQAGGQAAVGTLRAVAEQRRTGLGQWLDVSAQAAVVWTLLSESALPALHGFAPVRDGAYVRSAQSKRRVIFACRDGFVALSMGGGVLGAANMTALTALMAEHGMAPAFMRERDWKAWDTAYLMSLGPRAQAEIDAVADAVGAFVATRAKAELYAAALDRSLLLAPVSDMADLVRDAQLAARGALVDAFEPRLGRAVRRPGAVVQLAREPIAAPRPAPVLADARPADAVLRREWARPSAGRAPAARTARDAAPFAGLRVIDFAWVVTGPLTGRLLAEGGADVIRVESGKRLDPGRTLPPWPDAKGGVNRSQMFANANAGKRSVALDLARPEARELARRLVARADVVVESFTPGTMARWGLGYEDVRALRPDVVYLSTCQQGQTGPYAQYRGYGSLAAALAGFYAVTGWPDREPPMVYGAYTDFVAHHFATAAVLAALIERDRTGLGQHVDVSQLETGLHFLAPEILDYTVNGRIPTRRGNADPQMAPHGVYPCAGAPGGAPAGASGGPATGGRSVAADRWCAIACETDADWRALVRTMGAPAWATDARLETAAGRLAHAAELDAHLAAWTSAREPHALMAELQAAGVPAGAVQSCADLQHDPSLAEREALPLVDHPEMGRTPHEAWAFRTMGRAQTIRRAPCLGEHTHDVLREVLDLSTDEIARLETAGILA